MVYLATSMAFGLQSEATAQVLWEIDNLPDALLGKIEISKDMDSYNAANSLVHILENSGYPLATVFIKNDLLIVNLGRIDRYLRMTVAVALAIALFLLPIDGGVTVHIAMIVVGAVMALTSVVGYCPLYRLMGVQTA